MKLPTILAAKYYCAKDASAALRNCRNAGVPDLDAITVALEFEVDRARPRKRVLRALRRAINRLSVPAHLQKL